MRTFRFSDDKSYKFWNIDLQGDRFTVTFGKIGTRGQTQVKEFPDADKAQKAHDKLVAEKLGKGYVETTAAPSPAPSPLQRSLEEALVENADDLAAHSAYADYLAEQGDVRGELIQVQLALENPGWPEAERARLRQREHELLARHGRQWLGDLGRFLVGDWSGEDKPYHYQFVRGWLDTVRVLPFPEAVIHAVAKAPEARLLRRLEIVYDNRYHPFDFGDWIAGPAAAIRKDEGGFDLEDYWEEDGAGIIPALLTSPSLANLQVFKLGFSDQPGQLAHSTQIRSFTGCGAAQVIALLAKCPRLEELHLNTTLAGIAELFSLPRLDNLRVLQYYYGTEYGNSFDPGETYLLRILADNPSLGRLTTLRLHPGRDSTIDLDELEAVLRSPNLPALAHLQAHMTDFGDGVCGPLIDSGILRRLETLDLGYGALTDAGARVLADCPDLKRLRRLDVTRNALTERGINALRQTGVEVVADNQHAAGENDYLYEVDME